MYEDYDYETESKNYGFNKAVNQLINIEVDKRTNNIKSDNDHLSSLADERYKEISKLKKEIEELKSSYNKQIEEKIKLAVKDREREITGFLAIGDTVYRVKEKGFETKCKNPGCKDGKIKIIEKETNIERSIKCEKCYMGTKTKYKFVVVEDIIGDMVRDDIRYTWRFFLKQECQEVEKGMCFKTREEAEAKCAELNANKEYE